MTENYPAFPRISIADLFGVFFAHWKPLFSIGATTAILAFALAGLLPPKYTARMTLLPPQQRQSMASAALSSLGPLAALTGGDFIRAPSDQHVALMRSATVSDRILDRFKLREVYGSSYPEDQRRDLAARVRIAVGRKDGIITVEVDDREPQRAAAIANAYADELRRLTTDLAIAEAQQRAEFFDAQFREATRKLALAQAKVAENAAAPPVAGPEGVAPAAGEYFALRAEVAVADARLDALRNFARQAEAARVDEQRESLLVQVVDPATPPQKKAGPRKVRIAFAAAFVAGALAFAWFVYTSHARRKRA
jgi:uncharacterized protein involved in exopolysaccharide biosynthesis